MVERSLFSHLFLSLLMVLALLAGTAAAEGRRVMVLTIEGAIGPATADYVGRALQTAGSDQTELVVLRMDTPGGLDAAMRGIVTHITSSPIPIATYFAPTGARAASAGTYILYASQARLGFDAASLAAIEFTIDALFLQTPGPAAGERLKPPT